MAFPLIFDVLFVAVVTVVSVVGWSLPPPLRARMVSPDCRRALSATRHRSAGRRSAAGGVPSLERCAATAPTGRKDESAP